MPNRCYMCKARKENMISYFVALFESKLIVATGLYSISYIMGDAFICERGALKLE